MTDLKRLGATVRELRGDRSQADLGRAIGWSRERVSQLEVGRIKNWPEPEVFNRMADFLEVPVMTLLRAAGIRQSTVPTEDMEWLLSQLDDEGLELLAALGRALLPKHHRRPQTAA